MSKTYRVISVIDDRPTFAVKAVDILHECYRTLLSCRQGMVFTFECLTIAKLLSYRQVKWWKGILLPALSKQTGDTVLWWENRLKTLVMPDDFQPTIYEVNGKPHAVLPSISSLSMKKMNLLVEGTVEHLHDPKIYGDQFTWVTLPDETKRSGA